MGHHNPNLMTDYDRKVFNELEKELRSLVRRAEHDIADPLHGCKIIENRLIQHPRVSAVWVDKPPVNWSRKRKIRWWRHARRTGGFKVNLRFRGNSKSDLTNDHDS